MPVVAMLKRALPGHGVHVHKGSLHTCARVCVYTQLTSVLQNGVEAPPPVYPDTPEAYEAQLETNIADVTRGVR